jgi:Fe(3+) dicitrate transport protein
MTISHQRLFPYVVFFLIPILAGAQKIDTTSIRQLEEVLISTYRVPETEIKELPSVQSTYIHAGRKTEVIKLDDLAANIAEKTGRQIFAKVPGAFVYDMDGSGNQVNLATRGLDPHRSWEYNVRQNGVMTNSDIYGYPASHYSAPMEAIQRVELMRGLSSLQYGAQFGGMINYVTKQADTTRAFSFESQNSVGSFGLLSSFNAAGGRVGKWTYYTYFQKRVSEGYRTNARSTSEAQFAQLIYQATEKLSLKAELGRSTYLFRVPGPLTDSMFHADPRQATRSRNYFNPDIYVPSVSADWKLSSQAHLLWVNSAVLGDRRSVQFIGLANVPDTIDAATRNYKSRQVDIDQFNSYTSELRYQQNFSLFGNTHTLVSGVRYINNDLHRRQLGKGTTGTDYDWSVSGAWGRDVHLKSQNIAVFAEQLIRVNSRLDITAGVRLENGESIMSGKITYLPDDRVPRIIKHQYVLFGASGQYKLNAENKLYGGMSQAYRPVVFSDLIPATVLEQSNPDLQNAFGYNAEFGIKGKWLERLAYDVNYFRILYNNRIGTQALTDQNGQVYFYKTNIGNSATDGVEAYLDLKIAQSAHYRISIFTATSYMRSKYLSGSLRNGNENKDLTGNEVETVPNWISRNGLQLMYKGLSATFQHNYVADSFSDAFNTIAPTVTGAQGIVPSYHVFDLNFSARINAKLTTKFGINNLTNQEYFTKRPTGYPGQGVWNSDGRGLFLAVILRV